MPAFLEIVLESADFTLDGRDEVEDPLHEALTAAGIGEVTGGGSGMGKSNIDVEVSDLEAGLALVRRVLRDLKVAASTVIYAGEVTKQRGRAESPGIASTSSRELMGLPSMPGGRSADPASRTRLFRLLLFNRLRP